MLHFRFETLNLNRTVPDPSRTVILGYSKMPGKNEKKIHSVSTLKGLSDLQTEILSVLWT
jgi:hypothetical protein